MGNSPLGMGNRVWGMIQWGMGKTCMENGVTENRVIGNIVRFNHCIQSIAQNPDVTQ